MAPSRRHLTKANYETLATLRYALRRYLAFSAMAARKAGLSPQQHQSLLAIKGNAGREHLTVGELAERLQLKHHSAVGLVDRLARRGLVRRAAAPDDRRCVHVRLTPRGEAVLERLSATMRTELRRIGPQLRALLAKIGSSRRPA
ncbi:MAG: MarR family transcriptional regulator [Opitutaceae bacterium]